MNESWKWKKIHYFPHELDPRFYSVVALWSPEKICLSYHSLKVLLSLTSRKLRILTHQVPSLELPQLGSVHFSRSDVSDSLRPHESRPTRPLCPSSTPRACSNSCPLSQWCHPTISSSVVPFSSCPQSLPASGSFQWVNSLHEVAKVLEFQLQHQSF